jgi:hypothetical protein
LDDDEDFDTEGVSSSDIGRFPSGSSEHGFYDGARCAKVGLLCAAPKIIGKKPTTAGVDLAVLVDLATLPAGDFVIVVVIGSASDVSSKAWAYRRGLILPDVSQRGLDLNQSASTCSLQIDRQSIFIDYASKHVFDFGSIGAYP